MKSWTEIARRAAWWAALAAAAAAALAAPAGEPPVEQLRMPIDYHPDGRIKTQVTAGSARISAEGPVDATDVRVEMYGTNGTVEGRMEAKHCILNREAGTGTSDSDVRVQAQGAVITGTGFEWNAKARTVRILRNAKVVMEKNMKLPLPRGKPASGETKADAQTSS